MKNPILLIFFLVLSYAALATSPVGITNELSFRITYHNYHLGYIKAVKHALNATDTYTVLGKAEGDLFLKKIVSENAIYTVFEKKEFVKSITLFTRNGKTLNNTQTTLLKGKYIISSAEKTNQFLNQGINFTVALMYFQEPVGISNVYSEVWGKLLPLINNNNSYSFTIPDGTTCKFEYKEGVLVEVISKTPIGEIKFTKE